MTVRAFVSSSPAAPWAIPASTISAGRYLVRFARTEDELDRRFLHLFIEERESRTIVEQLDRFTYRAYFG